MNIFAPGGAWPRLNGVPGSRSRFGSRNFWKDFHHFKVEQNWTFGFIASGKKNTYQTDAGNYCLKVLKTILHSNLGPDVLRNPGIQ